ncbi:cytochrome P450 [Nocardia colli]|uniref:cytochrome P450 n=1 Tax=Nocardia colli TaxID=2545717 RepID=UPI0035D6D340
MRNTTSSPEHPHAPTEVDLTAVRLYTHGDPHTVWRAMRAERPVAWHDRRGGEGFWVVTRYADARKVLADHETFSSEGGTTLSMLDAPDPAAGVMMQASDPPRHRILRRELSGRFAASAMPAHAAMVGDYVNRALDRVRGSESWDLAEVFRPLPMQVGARLLGLPDADVAELLRLAYASLAPHDPRFSGAGEPEVAAAAAHAEILAYFSERIAERRSTPRPDDVLSHLLDVRIDGRALDDYAVLVNCLSLLLGAVVTTSHVVSGMVIALTEPSGGEGIWPDAPIAGIVEEGLRWCSPVIHFMRRARRDVDLHGIRIARGQAVTAWLASANRDEAVFPRPYELDVRREPNRHLAFGAGPHLCLGANLARLMLTSVFSQLISEFEAFELAGPAVHLASVEIAGVTSLPIRVRRRSVIGGRAADARRLPEGSNFLNTPSCEQRS